MANRDTFNIWNSIWNRVSTLIGGSFNVESPFGSRLAAIDQDTTIYVSATGKDTNPGTLDRPFLTIPAALEYLKSFRIEATVTVQVGAGNFGGFMISGLSLGNNGSVIVQGTLGTIAGEGVATGSSKAGVTLTLTDATKNWTVNEHKGRVVRVMSGTTAVYQICSGNTATTIDIITSLVGSTGNVYEIYSHDTVINAAGSFGGLSSSIMFGTNSGEILSSTAIMASRLKVTAGTIRFRNSSTGQLVLVNSTQVVATGGGYVATVTSCHFDTATSSITTTASNQSFGSLVLTNSSFIRGVSFGGALQARINNSKFAGTTGAGIAVIGPAATVVASGSVDISGYATGISCIESGWVGSDVAAGVPVIWIGTGNTLGYSATRGGVIQIPSTSTLASATDISVDGTTSTYAAFRALTPKVFPATNSYCSYVYE